MDLFPAISPLRRLAWLIFAMAAAPLAVAFAAQYAYGLHPCELCVLQRWPYAANLALAALLYASNGRWGGSALAHAAALVFLGDAAAALYHVAVEQRWIAGPAACAADAHHAADLDALKAQIMGQPLVVCADIAFRWLGLSMAAWNLLYALAAAGLTERFAWNKGGSDVVAG